MRTRIRPEWALLYAGLGLLAATACGSSVTDTGEPENPGTLIVPAQSGNDSYGPQQLLWTKDGKELVFHSSGLKAVDVGTHTVRPVWGQSSVVAFAGPTVSGQVYFSTFLRPPGSTTDVFTIARVQPATGTSEVLPLASPSLANVLVVSADERFVAADQVYDRQTGGTVQTPLGYALSFSPDGTALLYDNLGNAAPILDVVHTVQGGYQAVASYDEDYIANSWANNIPQLLRKRFDSGTASLRLYEVNGTSGATREMAQITTVSPTIYANYSTDGTKLGVWIQEDGIWKLNLIRPGAASRVVASVTYHASGNPGAPVFSPDNASLAYFLYDDSGRRLYVISGL